MNGPKLSVGVYGEQVKLLHEKLHKHGFDIPAGEFERGFFGPATRDAVRECQIDHGLKPTGTVDEATMAALDAAVGVQVRPIEISVKGIDLGGTQSSGQSQHTKTSQSPALPSDNMVAGRLVDTAGGCGSCGQLIFFGTPKNTTDARPIGATGTDRNGNFLMPKPAGNYSAVHAIAPGFVDLNANAQFQVPLDSNGAFPSSILLVGVQKITHDSNCECAASIPRAPGSAQLTDPFAPYSQDLGGGACVQLTTPNRTLETFVYTALVRVDEPRPLSDHDPSAATQVADPDSVGLAAAAAAVPSYLKMQAVTVSHAHLLQFDQTWKAHGYSLGDLLYSLPLAPCQKKQVAVVDWERREAGARSEVSTLQDQLVNTLTRDRDISEIVNGVLTENVKGSSAASVAGGAAGIGVAGSGSYGGANLGGVISAFGGGGSADSQAAQNAARGITVNSLQHIQDRTTQVAQMVRSLRTTVVQTVTQAETVKATTEVVANHNHCHALTIEYFEVLRHFLVEHYLAGVRECILVPFLITPFDVKRALHWREEIAPALMDGKWKSAFDAAERVVNSAPSAYNTEDLLDLQIDLQVTILVERPLDRAPDSEGAAQGPHYQEDTNSTAGRGEHNDPWKPLIALSDANNEPAGNHIFAAWYYNHYGTEDILKPNTEKYDILMTRLGEREKDFQAELAGKIAIQFMRQVQVSIPGLLLDASFFRVALVDKFQTDSPLAASVRLKKPLPVGIKASQVQQIQLQTSFGLPLGSRVVVRSATIRFRSAQSEWTVADASVQGDLADGSNHPVILSVTRTLVSSATATADVQVSTALIDHLNHNIEYYHRAIWTNLDDGRRFLLLDSLSDPKLNNHRRVASLVENRILGFLGNSMILPAAAGVHFDFFQPAGGTLTTTGQSLVDYYSFKSNGVAATRISLPTRGVFAEAILGECNACEIKDDSRFWRWEQSPCPEEPTAIQPVSTASRATPEPNLQAAPLPQSVINIQNAPAEPDPTGLKSALTLLGTSNLFKDITGVEQVNKNAVQAFSIAAQGAEQLAAQAAGLVKQQAMQQGGYDQQQKRIKQAEADGLISKQQASDLTYKALQTYGGQGSSTTSDTAGDGSTGVKKGGTGSGKPSGDTGSAAKSDGGGTSGSSGDTTGSGSDVIPIPTDTGTPDITAASFGVSDFASIIANVKQWTELNANTDIHKPPLPINQKFSDFYSSLFPEAPATVKCQYHSVDFSTTLAFSSLVDLLQPFDQLIATAGVVQCKKIFGQASALAMSDEFRFTVDSTPIRTAFVAFAALHAPLMFELKLAGFDPSSIPDRKFDTKIGDVRTFTGSFQYTALTLADHPYAGRRSWRLQALAANQFRLETGEINTFPWLPDYLAEIRGPGADQANKNWQQYLKTVVTGASGTITDSSNLLGTTLYLRKSELPTNPLVSKLANRFVGLRNAITAATASADLSPSTTRFA